MSTTYISSESVACGISLNWEVAHKAENHGEWTYSWNQIESELKGVWDTVNWSIGPRWDIDDILDDINTLRAIARAHAKNSHPTLFEEPESKVDVNIDDPRNSKDIYRSMLNDLYILRRREPEHQAQWKEIESLLHRCRLAPKPLPIRAFSGALLKETQL